MHFRAIGFRTPLNACVRVSVPVLVRASVPLYMCLYVFSFVRTHVHIYTNPFPLFTPPPPSALTVMGSFPQQTSNSSPAVDVEFRRLKPMCLL